MNIEKTECDRLGYEYASVLEHISYLCHHAPFIKDYIIEETMKKFDDLCLKLATGDCEIIEFKRTLCRYNFTDVLEEKDEKIDQLQSNWNSLRECIEENKKVATEYTKRIELSGLCQGDYPIPYYHAIKRIDLDNLYLDKMNELEGKDKD